MSFQSEGCHFVVLLFHLKFNVYNYTNKNLCKNRTDLHSMLSNENYKEKMTIFSSVCKIAGNTALQWRYRCLLVKQDFIYHSQFVNGSYSNCYQILKNNICWRRNTIIKYKKKFSSVCDLNIWLQEGSKFNDIFVFEIFQISYITCMTN